MQPMLALVLLSVAGATRTGSSSEIATESKTSPVGKVVKLLRDMQTTLAKEAKEDADLYKKMSCWCENNNSEKNAAVEAAQAAVTALANEIETRGATAEDLVLQIAAGEADQKNVQESLQRAEEQREKQSGDNRKDINEFRSNLEAIKTALYVLTKHMATAFPQMHMDFLAVRSARTVQTPEQVDALSEWMAKNNFATDARATAKVDAEVAHFTSHAEPAAKVIDGYNTVELAELQKARKLVTNFMQGQSGEADSTGHTGEIIGIMQQMKDDFAKSLSELEADDSEQQEQFKGMRTQLLKALAESEKMTRSKTAKHAENAKLRADAVENLEATKMSLDADTAFVLNLRETCANQDKEWATRSGTRQQEQEALTAALTILNSDDNKDLFSNSLGSGKKAFIQFESSESTSALARAEDRVIRLLNAAARKTGSPELLEIAQAVKLDKFPKVQKAIDDMVDGLKVQQKEEVEHKTFCEGALHENEMKTMETTNSRDGLQARIDDAQSTIESIDEEKAAAEKEIKDTLSAMQAANVERAEGSKDFQNIIADQRATRAILLKVLDRLEEFYKPAESFVEIRAASAPPSKTPVEKMLKDETAERVEVYKAKEEHKKEVKTAHKEARKLAHQQKQHELEEKQHELEKEQHELKEEQHELELEEATKTPTNVTETKVVDANATANVTNVSLVHTVAAVKADYTHFLKKDDDTPVPSNNTFENGTHKNDQRGTWHNDMPVETKKEENQTETTNVTKPSVNASLVQGGQTPPGEFKEYKKHAGSGSVLVMLRGLITDAQNLEADAISEENSAVQSYVGFVGESQEMVGALQRKVLSCTERRAASETQMSSDKFDHEGTLSQLELLSSEKAETHKACDYVLKNFDIRQAARQQEIDALGQAKSILGGAQ